MQQKISNYLFAFLAALYLVGCESYKNTTNEVLSQKEKDAYVLLISFDGFRHDYAKKYNLPNFKRMMKEGSYARSMLPSFPSKTFPNHYSIITGMYPGNHELVDNKYYDKNRNDFYSIGDRDKVEDAYYYSGTPLWQHLQKYGMKTASFFWVGSEAPILGKFPTYYQKYNGSITNENRIKKVMKWLRLPKEKRPRFITLYFSLVDSEGHRTGPNSLKLQSTVKEADRLMGVILDSVQNIDLPITTIVTSDHGMTEMTSNPQHIFFLQNKLSPIKDKIIFVNNKMHAHIYVKNNKDIPPIYRTLKDSFKNTPIRVLLKEEAPKRWHYSDSNRVGDILLVTEAPNYMLYNKNHPVTRNTKPWGTHGYDPYTTPDMGAIFYIIGNNIKENYQIEEFENVNIFPLITKILGVPNPENIDGKEEVLKGVLKNN